MARPRKNNAEYFSHDAGMRNDDKIKSVRRRFKHEGYSVWNMLLEKLCSSANFSFKYDENELELMAGDFDIDETRLNEIIEYFARVRLIVIENSVISSTTLITRMEPLLSKRKRERGELSPLETMEFGDVANESTQSKVKDSKVQENNAGSNKDNKLTRENSGPF